MINKGSLEKLILKECIKHRIDGPEIARNQYESEFSNIDFDEFDHIVFAGMESSGVIGDIFTAILSKTNIHVEVIKGYVLPKNS